MDAPATDDCCIRLVDVSKVYRRRHMDAMLLREILPSRASQTARDDDWWALRDVALEVDRGEAVAVLGKNGSGKSTLLGLVAGSTKPTAGVVSVRGRVAPILALGVGFEEDMTAVENAYLNATLLGVDEEEIQRSLPTILEFAGLRDFVDTPVRHYSAGMLARLGFAIAMHVEREILLVDEVLAVGDQEFRHRCIERVRELSRDGMTLMFATHDFETAKSICTRGVWLRDGAVAFDGELEPCVQRYQRYLEEAAAP